MDIKEKLALEMKYKELPDEALLDMLADGKEAYREGAYEVLRQEARRRGISLESAAEGRAQDKDGAKPTDDPREAELDTFVETIIVNHKDDIDLIESALSGKDIKYYFQALSLRGNELPVSLMVEQEKVEDAIELLKSLKPQSSIVLW